MRTNNDFCVALVMKNSEVERVILKSVIKHLEKRVINE